MTALLVNIDRPAGLVLAVVCVLIVLGGVMIVGLAAASSGRSQAASKRGVR